jgi:methylamine dehydrogenase heavy chain
MQSFARCALALSLTLGCAAAFGAGATQAASVPPPLPADHLTVERLSRPGPHWVYVVDYAFDNEIDSRVRLYDGDVHRRLGQIDAGFLPGFTLSPDGATAAVTATYFARGGHGARTDVVELNDTATLAITREIVLPPKKLQAIPTLFNIAYSSDGHFLYVAYMTPAASLGVLDPAQGTVLGEIDTAGCPLVIPSGPNRVSSICESGRLLTVTLDAQGHEASRALSAPFFDADQDPVFVQGMRSANGFAFVSFLGEFHDVDLSGPAPVFAAPWSLVTPAERGHWRPGGNQIGSIQLALGRLYVLMHAGGEGSHKEGATEVWVFDLASHRRLARWPLKPRGLALGYALEVSQDSSPVLFVATGEAQLAVLDAASGSVRRIEKHFGQTPWQLVIPPEGGRAP